MTELVIYRLWYAMFLFAPSSGSILRLPCKKFADFKVSSIGKRLKGSVLMQFYGLQDTQCMVKCVENANCRSYNTNNKDGRCDINGKASDDYGATLSTDWDWIYKSTDYSSKLVGPVCESLNPCGDKILCKDSCDPPYYKCVYCDADREGLHCDVPIDWNECLSNPCKNLGECVDKFADYQCICLNGYKGKNCEIDIDECASLPCFNGGRCVNKIGNYACNCTRAVGYTGRNCERERDECLSNPCKNSGTCVDKFADYNCTCLNGYKGKNCEIDIDECLNSPCLNNGSCINDHGNYSCNCTNAIGYTGRNCETVQVELNIIISSYGKSDPGYNSGRPFKINGVITGTSSRGFNILVLSHINGQTLGAKGFDTYQHTSKSAEMIEFIESFPDGSIIVVCAWDSAHAKLTQDAKDYLVSLGSVGVGSIALRTSLAMLTAKGNKPTWFVEKFAAKSKGPSIINAVLRSPFV